MASTRTDVLQQLRQNAANPEVVKQIDKVAYLQFLEDSCGTATSFKTGGTMRFHIDPSGKEVEV